MSLLESFQTAALPSSSVTTTPRSPKPPPIQTYQLRQIILGIPTELLVQTFSDRILVIITQNGKVGCLTQASLPPHLPLPAPSPPSPSSSHPHIQRDPNDLLLAPPHTSTLLTPLLGSPPSPTLYNLYISQISTLIWWSLQEVSSARRGVVVGLSLAKSPSSNIQIRTEGDGQKHMNGNGNGNGVGPGKEAESQTDLKQEDGDGDGDEDQSEEERERFMAIMKMVVSWPGPEVEGAAADIVD